MGGRLILLEEGEGEGGSVTSARAPTASSWSGSSTGSGWVGFLLVGGRVGGRARACLWEWDGRVHVGVRWWWRRWASLCVSISEQSPAE